MDHRKFLLAIILLLIASVGISYTLGLARIKTEFNIGPPVLYLSQNKAVKRRVLAENHSIEGESNRYSFPNMEKNTSFKVNFSPDQDTEGTKVFVRRINGSYTECTHDENTYLCPETRISDKNVLRFDTVDRIYSKGIQVDLGGRE